jgi:osmotically inducible protein OsmC
MNKFAILILCEIRSKNKEFRMADMIRKSEAHWEGNVLEGSGTLALGSGVFNGPYSFKARTTDGMKQTNPEELIAAAHAGCFSMALSAILSKAGHTPTNIDTIAKVHLDSNAEGFFISEIELETEADIPGISETEFREFAETAKKNCPVSKALASVPIHFKAKLKA